MGRQDLVNKFNGNKTLNKRLIKTVSFNQARKPIYKSAIKSSSMFEKYLDKLFKNLNF